MERAQFAFSFSFGTEFQSRIAQLKNVEKAAPLTFGNLKLNEPFLVLYLWTKMYVTSYQAL